MKTRLLFFNLFILSSLLILVVHCTSYISQKNTMEFKVIESGSYGGISTVSENIVNDIDKFNSLFSELHKNIFPSTPPSYSVNKSYIFITFGEKSSGGLDFKIKEIRNDTHEITVVLESIYTNSDGPLMVTDAIANPYMVIEINKTPIKNISLIKE